MDRRARTILLYPIVFLMTAFAFEGALGAARVLGADRAGAAPADVPAVQTAVATDLAAVPAEAADPYPATGAIAAQLRTAVSGQDPTAAFAVLRSALHLDPHLAIQCHALTHVIGNAAFAKYGNFQDAVRFNDDLCGAGYVHSLIENVLRGSDDPAAIINAVCEKDDGYCFHGIGHGAMFYTANDVPESLGYCAKITDAEGAGRCSEGVFMQNFEDDQTYDTPYTYADDPLRLCREEPRFKSACYHYAGAYLAAKHWKTDANVFARCDAAEKGWRVKCVSGMGAHLLALHLDAPQKAEAKCDGAPTAADRAACVDGMVSYHLVNYNSIPQTTAFCAAMNDGDRAACAAALKAREASYR